MLLNNRTAADAMPLLFQNRFYKKAAAFVLRAVAKHSAPLAQAVVDSGALDALVSSAGNKRLFFCSSHGAMQQLGANGIHRLVGNSLTDRCLFISPNRC
jgi:hypothetical protein